MKKKVREIMSGGSRCRTSLFNLYYVRSAGYKIGFISRHTSGNPSQRNFGKRIIREYWRRKFKTGDYIFVIKPPLVVSDAGKLIGELEKISGMIR